MVDTVNFTTNIERTLHTLSIAFSVVPCNTFILKKISNIPYDVEVSKERIDLIMKSLIELCLDKGGFIVEVDDFAAVGVFTPPGLTLNMPLTSDLNFNEAFVDRGLFYRKKYLRDIDYYYLFLLGKDFTVQGGKGGVRSIFDQYKKKCDEQNCALVLECINEKAKSMYEYFGFKTYGIYQIGQNEVNSNGEVNHEGKGFTIYFMIYYKCAIHEY